VRRIEKKLDALLAHHGVTLDTANNQPEPTPPAKQARVEASGEVVA
jgi:hypothetical protein